MSQSRIKVEKRSAGLEVRMSLGEVRANSKFGSEGVQRFLEFYATEPDDRVVICNMETGSLKLEGAETVEKSEVKTLVN